MKYEAMFKQRPESGWREEWNQKNEVLLGLYGYAWAQWLIDQRLRGEVA